MRIAVLGASVLASLVSAALVAALAPNVGFAQRTASPPMLGSGGLIALATAVGEQRQQVTIIDPATRVLGVYHIELSSGEVTLKSVRNLHWDLQMMEFNGTSPLPGEVRSILEQH
jgi:hypothetical protein